MTPIVFIPPPLGGGIGIEFYLFFLMQLYIQYGSLAEAKYWDILHMVYHAI